MVQLGQQCLLLWVLAQDLQMCGVIFNLVVVHVAQLAHIPADCGKAQRRSSERRAERTQSDGGDITAAGADGGGDLQ